MYLKTNNNKDLTFVFNLFLVIWIFSLTFIGIGLVIT